MRFVNFMNNLIMKINSQHLLKNGAGRAHNNVFDSTAINNSTIFDTILKYVLQKLSAVAEVIYRLILQLVYFIVNLALNIMDFIMVIISELSGQAQSFDLAQVNSNLENSDIIFKFFFNSLTVKILQRVFIFSLLILIIITIVAIIKNEWQRATDEKARDTKAIVAKALKSVFMMVFTPFVVIVGIVFSNVLLTTTANAINGGKSFFSVGSIIFMSGTYEANWYRIYADNNDKIPILFDFNGGFYNADNGRTSNSNIYNLDEEVAQLKQNKYLTSGYSTYSMFENKAYFTFNQVPEDSKYYAFYDGDFLKTKRIEYYVMADFIDYAMETGQEFYIKNVEDVYNMAVDTLIDSDYELYPAENEAIESEEEDKVNVYYRYFDAIFNNIIPYELDENDSPKKMELYGTTPSNPNIHIIYDENKTEYFEFNVHYNEELLASCGDVKIDEDAADKGLVTYESLSGADDEAYGAKYLYCYKVQVPLDVDATKFRTLYVPVQQNSNSQSYFNFSSDYLEDAKVDNGLRSESLFVARGGFNTFGAPTAIREDGSEIVFYRHDVSMYTWYKAQPQQSYLSTDDAGKEEIIEADGDFFTRVLGFDSNNLDLNIQILFGSMPTYSKQVWDITTLSNGQYKLNYSFVNTNLNIDNVYNLTKMNFLILIIACLTLMSTLFWLIFSLLKRILELTVYWFTYPAWLTPFPLDSSDSIIENTAFARWRVNFIDRVMAIYTTYIGLVLYYALVPAILSIDFASGVVIDAGVDNMFNHINPVIVSWTIRVMFLLVLFTMLKTVNEMVQDLIGGGHFSEMNDGKDYWLDSEGKFNGIIVKNVKAGVGMFSIGGNWKKLKQGARDAKDHVLMNIPGAVPITEALENVRATKVNNTRNQNTLNLLTSPTRVSSATDDTVKDDIDKMNEERERHKGTAEAIEEKSKDRTRLIS